jgi:hypothetical protein
MIQHNAITQPGDSYDRQVLVERLQVFYKTEDMDRIRLYLKRDLKESRRIKPLLKDLDYDIDDLVIHLAIIFDNLFTNLLIKRLRSALEEIKNNE